MLFGTSGIRGIYGKEVSGQLAMKIANLFAKDKLVVAMDTRTTGESLAFSAISGALGKGCDVVYLGVVPTPTLALATEKYRCRGIMVTASHNPPEYNGIKLYEKGKEITRKMEKEIEGRYAGQTLFTAWDKAGKIIGDAEGMGRAMLSEHMKLIMKNVDVKLISGRRPKVVVDANGAGTVITADALRMLGCEVIEINAQRSGFSRASEPNSENLKMLSAKVLETHADLGIGHDGDADRTVVCDENGEVLPLDVQLAIMCRHELDGIAGAKGIARKTKKAKQRIVSTVEASLCVREAVEGMGAEIMITPVGSLYVSEAIEREGAVFGGEPCGEYVFPGGLAVPDGIMTAAKFVDIFCKDGKLSRLKMRYKTYPMAREKFGCENARKYEIVKRMTGSIRIKGKKNEDDGLRIDEDDGWFLIRASGTEPFVRLTLEYKSDEKLGRRKKELGELILKNI